MKPSTLSKAQWLNIGKTLLYIGVSAVIGGALAQLQNNPAMFGIYTPMVNLALVALKQVFTNKEA